MGKQHKGEQGYIISRKISTNTNPFKCSVLKWNSTMRGIELGIKCTGYKGISLFYERGRQSN